MEKFIHDKYCGWVIGVIGATISVLPVYAAIRYLDAPNSFFTYYVVGLIVFAVMYKAYSCDEII